MNKKAASDFNEVSQIKRFLTGENFYCHSILGCHKSNENDGYLFRVWAPNAKSIWLVGDFNNWETSLTMSKNEDLGIWEVFSTSAKDGDYYKYKVVQNDGKQVYKIDPFSLAFEKRPNTASKIYTIKQKKWKDGLWRGRNKRMNHFKRPMNIYEVHAGSWKQHIDGKLYSFKDLTRELIPYLKKMNYTHVEFMPIMEHPLDASWGYQLTGYFALSSVYGKPEEFQDFVEKCHLNNIGVIIDWVPGHFCSNNDALRYFDGTPQFEYFDQNRATNIRWGALNFDLGKPEVQSFLISSALFWIETYHIDGIRVDAVSNMIYRDSDLGPWTLNHEGTNVNLEGYYFLKKLNSVINQLHPNVFMIAEESSAGMKVTGRDDPNSLGFDYKWSLGWMNDTLRFYEIDPVYRKYHFDLVTFPFMYAHNENYILSLSHDEVVHGKKSLMNKMWGDRYKQFAQLRNLYVNLITHPGKQLIFMGGEWGQYLEWKYHKELEWGDLQDDLNKKMQHFTETLNRMYKEERSLWELDVFREGIEFIDGDNANESIISFIRKGKRKRDFLIVILNMLPVERKEFLVSVPYPGEYRELLNSESLEFGGTWVKGNSNSLTFPYKVKQFKFAIKTILPSFGALLIKPENVNLRFPNK